MRFLQVELAPTVSSSWLSASCRSDNFFFFFYQLTVLVSLSFEIVFVLTDGAYYKHWV